MSGREVASVVSMDVDENQNDGMRTSSTISDSMNMLRFVIAAFGYDLAFRTQKAM